MSDSVPASESTKPKNLSEELSEWSYLNTLTQEELRLLDEQIDTLREMSAPLEKVEVPINDISRLGTGAFLTNTPSAEFLKTFGDDAFRVDAITKSMERDSQRRFWGDTDVRGCYLVVIESGDTVSAIHLPFNAAEDLENFTTQVSRLTLPLGQSNSSSAKVHIAGGFEEPASRDTMAALTHFLAKNIKEVEIGTLDVLGRDQGARMPIFDIQERKMYEVSLS